MMRHKLVADAVVLKKDARRAGVLGKHQVRLLEYADGAECHVFHVAHRSGNNVHYAHKRGKCS